jgi:AbrB family looped-hinge helix DNA binding protein
MENVFAVVSSKGQIVIPAELRQKLGITTGTRIAIEEHGNQLVLQPITEAFIRSVRGCCKGGPAMVEGLIRDRRAEDR